MRNRNDRGFSLVELIVVIAIMVVFTGVGVIGYGMLNGRQAKECRDELEAKLQSVRVQTMGKRTVVANLSENSGGGYVLTVTSTLGTGSAPATTTTEYKLGGKSCHIYYSCDESAVYAEGASGLVAVGTGGLLLEFDRASGAMKELPGGGYVYHIFVVQGSRVYGIRFYPETGKMELE